MRPVDQLFPHLQDAIKNKLCFVCKTKIEAFRDALSAHEYSISGLCQECQDSVFCEEPE